LIIGEGTEIEGKIRFVGALHIDGEVVGDVSGQLPNECAWPLDSPVQSRVTSMLCMLCSIAPSKATFGPPIVPSWSRGAHRGQALLWQAWGTGRRRDQRRTVHIDEHQTPQVPDQGEDKEQTGDEGDPEWKAAPGRSLITASGGECNAIKLSVTDRQKNSSAIGRERVQIRLYDLKPRRVPNPLY